jgi:EpsI family protein
MKPFVPWRRFWPVIIVMTATASLLYARANREIVPERRDFSSFPTRIDGWVGADVALLPEELAVLGKGDFLVRDYTRGTEMPMNLFLAYYPSQRSGDTIHSPRNCLPGAGWTPLQAGKIQIPGYRGASMTVNRYIVGQGSERMLVLYWYQAHGRVTRSEYWAKISLVTDSMRLNRTDGALVRVLTSYDTEGGERQAEARAVAFTQDILPMLDAHIPQ